MTRPESRAPRTVRLTELDSRLAAPSGRTDRLQVLIDHDSPGVGPCPSCGWATTTTQRDCPSRVVALCLLEARPLPSWLVHLAGRVPGVRVRAPRPTDGQRREAEDAADGLFPAPCRATTREDTT